jgi:hypothetical protein
MKEDVCTEFDRYMKIYCHDEVNISWSMLLLNGFTLYGDYERPDHKPCWERVKLYCEREQTVPVNVKLYMFGHPEVVFFEDPNGLDGISIHRGVAREQSLEGATKDFQFLSVSLMDSDCQNIEVRKFVWPVNEFEQLESKRSLTEQNIKPMIFKHDSEKRKREEVQKHINGTAL